MVGVKVGEGSSSDPAMGRDRRMRRQPAPTHALKPMALLHAGGRRRPPGCRGAGGAASREDRRRHGRAGPLADRPGGQLASRKHRAVPFSYWDEMAARLVDAQAPAAATQVRRLAASYAVATGGQAVCWPTSRGSICWPLVGQGTNGCRRRKKPTFARRPAGRGQASLSSPARRNTTAGMCWLAARPRKNGSRPCGPGFGASRPTGLRWSWTSPRPGASPAWELWPGNVVDAAVARFPGTAQLRVIVAERNGEAEVGGAPPAWADLGRVAQARGEALAADPWPERWPVSVASVVPERQACNWGVTGQGRALHCPGHRRRCRLAVARHFGGPTGGAARRMGW